jgi:hypothetical protein
MASGAFPSSRPTEAPHGLAHAFEQARRKIFSLDVRTFEADKVMII